MYLCTKNLRLFNIVFSLVLLDGLQQGLSFNCSNACLANTSSSASASVESASGASSVEVLFKEMEDLVKQYYPRAKFTASDSKAHFEYKLKTEDGYYSGRPVLVPQPGGILGELSVKAGEYIGPDKNRLPSESNDGFNTTLIMAPYSAKSRAHLSAKLVFGPDVSTEFKDTFKQIVSKFNAHEVQSAQGPAGEDRKKAGPAEAVAKIANVQASTQTAAASSSANSVSSNAVGVSNSANAASSSVPSANQSPQSETAEKRKIVKAFLNSVYPPWTRLIDDAAKNLCGQTDKEIAQACTAKSPALRQQQKQSYIKTCGKKAVRLKQLLKEQHLDGLDLMVELFTDTWDGGVHWTIQDYRDLSMVTQLVEKSKLHLDLPTSFPTDSVAQNKVVQAWSDRMGKKFERYSAKIKAVIDPVLTAEKPGASTPHLPAKPSALSGPAGQTTPSLAKSSQTNMASTKGSTLAGASSSTTVALAPASSTGTDSEAKSDSGDDAKPAQDAAVPSPNKVAPSSPRSSSATAEAMANTATSDAEREEKKEIIRKVFQSFGKSWETEMLDNFVNEENSKRKKLIDDNKKLSDKEKSQQKEAIEKQSKQRAEHCNQLLHQHNIDFGDLFVTTFVEAGDEVMGWSLQDYRSLGILGRLCGTVMAAVPANLSFSKGLDVLMVKMKPAMMSSTERIMNSIMPAMRQVGMEAQEGRFNGP